ncbi:MAG: hypothetical protein JNK32_00855 [Anaerolineales bacterium]|nr:hypothetical protein [Anaerolineales bacterium]
MKKLTIILLLAVLLAACAPGGIQIPQSPVLKFLERKSGLIAYVGNDGNVYVTDQGATSTTQLTDDVTEATQGQIGYQLPAWSLDGSQVAFIRLEQNSSTSLISNLVVANIDDGTVTKVYTSETEYPFYIHWSPDNKHIGALSTTAQQQTLLLQSIPADGGERRVLDTGSPFYWSWSPDGSAMIVHKSDVTGNSHQLSFLKLGDELIEYVLDVDPALFQAPAWSPSGEFILLPTLSEDGKQQLTLTDATGALQRVVADFDINTAFAWAADSEQFAYISGVEQMQTGAIGSLHVANVNDSEEIVVDNQVIGFFWSPDGDELAYLIPLVVTPEGSTGQVLLFELNILDVASGESSTVATFQPSEQFTNLIPYFDQYHQSITIWSPDSNNLVISFIGQSGTPTIAIVPSSGVTEPRFLAEGSLGIWSWK